MLNEQTKRDIRGFIDKWREYPRQVIPDAAIEHIAGMVEPGLRGPSPWIDPRDKLPEGDEEKIFIIKIVVRASGAVRYDMIVTEGFEAPAWIKKHDTMDEHVALWVEIFHPEHPVCAKCGGTRGRPPHDCPGAGILHCEKVPYFACKPDCLKCGIARDNATVPVCRGGDGQGFHRWFDERGEQQRQNVGRRVEGVRRILGERRKDG